MTSLTNYLAAISLPGSLDEKSFSKSSVKKGIIKKSGENKP